MSTIKPKFPTITPQDLHKGVDRLQDKVAGATGADGTVDVKKLEADVDAAGDAALSESLRDVKDTFSRTEKREVWGGCSTYLADVQVPPERLDKGDVQSVMSALLEAKAALSGLDKDGDGKLSRAEAAAAKALPGLAGEIAEAMVDSALVPWEREMQGWAAIISRVSDSVDNRQNLEFSIRNRAEHHAETPLGAEAIAWAYRDLAVQGRTADVWNLSDALKAAETSFLRHLPLFFGRVEEKPQHLSDREVARFLQVDDLAAFVEQKKAAVTERAGGDYEAWLAGKGIEGVEHTKDPDFFDRRVTPGC